MTRQESARKDTERMMSQIEELEHIARGLEPPSETRSAITREAAAYIDQFIESLPTSRAYTKADCPILRSVSIGKSGKTFGSLLDIVRGEVDQAGINTSSGANFAYIQGGGVWTSSIGDMLAAATNRYAGVFFSSPGAVIIENQMIRWLSSVVGYPPGAHGNLSSGGSIANLIAVQTARDSCNVDSTNVRSHSIYFTQHMHHCLHKALHTTGLHEAVHRTIPMNSRHQMNTDALREMLAKDKTEGLRPLLVIATAGTTDTGAVDPLADIADLCARFGAWFHVDAAYGGFFNLLDEMKTTLGGIERSDSVVMDPHKSMFLPFGTGVVLIRNGEALRASTSHEAPYMQDTYGFDDISPADSGPELTKHFRGLRMWLPLHLHGTDAFKANLLEKVLLCRYFHEEIGKLGFETGPYPDLSITLFRFPANDRNAFNQELLRLIHADGRCFFSSTMIGGEFWIRCAVLSFRTHLAEVQLAIRMIGENLKKVQQWG
jgi:aromatic-L-amino-acid/L-tryptophan decarboxylase